ncbi:MAG: MarR family transcriptional regulator [Candidatus Omnitrophica bacterium]|nr:MarR family transcriptional regulator [Candidatus Omnitrophota bacterium]MDE2008844.1 MarR family transcriptional regulator [Candidatus Omnitrophota bacterium]MDE2213593.1 MarR family transcriptional regulator [Candidatus Omnitrophota bacterium]MDE2230506.1 MarR family transcriptional regulator [Candidatus Omnitrophota bacterium]
MNRNSFKTKPSPSLPEDHFSYWLRYVSNSAAYSFSRKLRQSRVTVAEWIVLRQLYGSENLSPGEVARKTGLTQGAVSKLMNRLLRKKLVTRVISSKDRRYKELRLTKEGKSLVPRLARIADENDDQFFGDILPKQRKAWIDLLKSIIRKHRLRKVIEFES